MAGFGVRVRWMCRSVLVALRTWGSRSIKSGDFGPLGNHQERRKDFVEDLFSIPSQCWKDQRGCRYRYLKHKVSRETVWSNGQNKYLWFHYRLVTSYAQLLSELRSVSVKSSRLDDELQSTCKAGELDRALGVLLRMDEQAIVPSVQDYRSLLHACSKSKALIPAKQVHAHLIKHGLGSSSCLDEYVVSTLVKCGGLEDALQVLTKMSHPTISSLTALICGYTKAGRGREALNMYKCMWEESFEPDKYIFVSLLRACGSVSDLAEGKRVHAKVLKYSCQHDLLVGTCLVDMYAKCGSIADAQHVFDELSHRDVVAWTVILAAYTRDSQAWKALQLYEQMQEEGVSPNDRTCVTVLQACGLLAEKEDGVVVDGRSTKVISLKKGMEIHARAWTKGYDLDVFVSSTLITMYGKGGSILSAQSVFDGLSLRNPVSWNAMLAAYLEQGQAEMALQMYEQMCVNGMSPADRTSMSMMQACGLLGEKEEDVVDGQRIKFKSLAKGKALHALARTKKYHYDVFVGSTLVSMYAKCGSIVDAKVVFDGLSQRNVVSWTAMLWAYARQGEAEKVLQLYHQMREEDVCPNDWTFVSLCQAIGILAVGDGTMVVDGQSSRLSALGKGKSIHAETQREGCHTDVFVGNALVSMYGKCGSIMDAQNVFDGLPHQDVVSWTSMLAAYIQEDQEEKALQLYRQMQQDGVTPNEVTLVSMLHACSKTGCLDLCRQIHRTIVLTGKNMSLLLGNTLVHAYGRCASMTDAKSVFDSLTQRDVVSWTALIAGHARQGNSAASLHYYDEMQLSGIKPDGVTFLSILSACTFAGLVERGVEYFESMSRNYGITPEVEHYVTMVDLLARAGCFKTVEHLLSKSPVQPTLAMCLCLLSACRKHGLVALGKHAFDCAVNIQVQNVAAYALMLNIYADAGMWDCAKGVKALGQKVGAWQNPGKSWIELDGIHSFVVGDSRHLQQQDQLYQMLGKVCSELDDSGLVPITHSTLNGGNEEIVKAFQRSILDISTANDIAPWYKRTKEVDSCKTKRRQQFSLATIANDFVQRTEIADSCKNPLRDTTDGQSKKGT